MSVNDELFGGLSREDDVFVTTCWSIVVTAKRSADSSALAQQALTQLCRQYWIPLYAYARRRFRSIHDAQDITQSFFLELLNRQLIESATPERGRFRAFLITAFKNFIAKQHRRNRAQKRGGTHQILSLEFASAEERWQIEPALAETPDQLYERQWALTLLGQVMRRLEEEYRREGKDRIFNELKGYLVGDGDDRGYHLIADKLTTSPGAAKMAAHRLRRRYRELLRYEVAQTVSATDSVDDELRALLAALGS